MSTDPQAGAPVTAPTKHKRRRKRKRKPSVQLGGLHVADVAALAATRRVVVAVQAPLWNDLSPRSQSTLRRGVAWRLVATEAPPVMVSEMLDVDGKLHKRVTRKLRGEFVLFESRALQRWAHLARVRYRDGRVVAFGAHAPLESLADAEQATPVATFEAGSDAPVPWEGLAHGHLPAELLAAPTFDKAAPAAPPRRAPDGRPCLPGM